jgi:hypothetical protein
VRWWSVDLALVVGMLLLGAWQGRWWVIGLPLGLLLAGVLYAFTLSAHPSYEDPSRRSQMVGVTLIFTLPLLLGVVTGTLIGIRRRRYRARG